MAFWLAFTALETEWILRVAMELGFTQSVPVENERHSSGGKPEYTMNTTEQEMNNVATNRRLAGLASARKLRLRNGESRLSVIE